MSTTAIVLLILGLLFFAASFFLPDGVKEKEEKNKDEERIKAIVDKEVSKAKERIEDMVEETVTYSVEKTERQLEKLSNEKIMAVDEYSETVLKKINDNHQEAVFLYDMLNDKDQKLKDSGLELENKNEEIKEKSRELEVREEVLKAKEESLEIERKNRVEKEPVVEKTAEQISFVPFTGQNVETVVPIMMPEPEPVPFETKPLKETAVPEVQKKNQKETKQRTVKKPIMDSSSKIPQFSKEPENRNDFYTKEDTEKNVDIRFDTANEGRKNNNELIRKMHEEGKSNMAIAKELGLGVGEVKLVIDLFSKKR